MRRPLPLRIVTAAGSVNIWFGQDESVMRPRTNAARVYDA